MAPMTSTENALIICSKDFFAGLIFGGAYFQRGFLYEGILCFKISWA